MKEGKTPEVNVPWGDAKARELNRKRPERVKMQKDREKRRSEEEKKEMLRRKSPEELESDPRTTGALEAIRRAILGKKKEK
tara:strand:+ start:84091 stop:84333 length:243 start_codon:yes stop_codon:yes gene_type:complete